MPDKQLDDLIFYWENKLQYDKFLMSPSTVALAEQTVTYLKELRQLKAAKDA